VRSIFTGVCVVFERITRRVNKGTFTMAEALPDHERISWHSLSIEEVYERLCAGPSGLSPDEAEKRLVQYGPNVLPVRKPPGVLILFLRQFKSPLIYILLIAALISYLLYDINDAAFILLVVLLNAGIGLVQEWKAEQSAGRLEKLLHITAHVRSPPGEVRASLPPPGCTARWDPSRKQSPPLNPRSRR
jgi:magnesium-transporting ATPase (P-type)